MTNRQEVAEKIRKIGEYDCYETALYEIDEIIGTGNSPLFSDFLNRLADLIDPTCHMVDSEWDNGECTWGCICQECGSKFEHKRAIYLNYCPNCGARVVRDDD